MAKTLSELVPGASAVITRLLPGADGLRQRLLDMGITRGTSLMVVRRAPLGDPIQIEVKGYHLALRTSEADLIEVDEHE